MKAAGDRPSDLLWGCMVGQRHQILSGGASHGEGLDRGVQGGGEQQPLTLQQATAGNTHKCELCEHNKSQLWD